MARKKRNLPIVDEAEKTKRGRPSIPIDRDKLEVLAKYLATEEDIAQFFNTQRSVISRYIKKEYGCDFKTFRASQHMNFKYQMINKVVKYVNANLINAIENKGRLNNQMLIFLMKNLCDWRDRVENTNIGDLMGSQQPIINFGIEGLITKTIDVDTEVNNNEEK